MFTEHCEAFPSLAPSWSVIITKTFYVCVCLSFHMCVFSHRGETLVEEEPSSPTSLPEGIHTSGIARILARNKSLQYYM